MSKTCRYLPPPERPTAEAWPGWVAALQTQARYAASTIPGNPLNAPTPSSQEVAAMRSAFIANGVECKCIAALLLSGRLGEDTTMLDLTPERLRGVWAW